MSCYVIQHFTYLTYKLLLFRRTEIDCNIERQKELQIMSSLSFSVSLGFVTLSIQAGGLLPIIGGIVMGTTAIVLEGILVHKWIEYKNRKNEKHD